MSLFGALMGDMDDDPFMGGHMRRMNSMMNSFFSDPFGDMLGRSMGADLMPFGGGARDARRGHGHGQVARFGDFGMMPMMPMGFPNIGNIFQSMSNNPNCHSFSSSTVMTMTPGPDGRPQIYQASQSVKQGPGGVRETKKTVADSRTGVKKMAIGHHINERGHIIEREQNVYSGEAEERQDFINLDEEEAESFNREWESKARHFVRNNNAIDNGKHSRRRASREPQLALPSSASGHNSRYNARSSRPQVYHSSSNPSTSALASDSEEVVVEEVESVDGSDAEAENVSSVIIEEVEDGEPQKKERTPDKRKVVVEEVLSSGEEEESPEPKSKKLRKQNPTSKSKASSRSSK